MRAALWFVGSASVARQRIDKSLDTRIDRWERHPRAEPGNGTGSSA